MSHYLLVFDRARGEVLQEREFPDGPSALDARFQIEREQKRDDDIEIVVLDAESPEALRRTHARYFETPAELLRGLADALPH